MILFFFSSVSLFKLLKCDLLFKLTLNYIKINFFKSCREIRISSTIHRSKFSTFFLQRLKQSMTFFQFHQLFSSFIPFLPKLYFPCVLQSFFASASTISSPPSRLILLFPFLWLIFLHLLSLSIPI